MAHSPRHSQKCVAAINTTRRVRTKTWKLNASSYRFFSVLSSVLRFNMLKRALANEQHMPTPVFLEQTMNCSIGNTSSSKDFSRFPKAIELQSPRVELNLLNHFLSVMTYSSNIFVLSQHTPIRSSQKAILRFHTINYPPAFM